MDPETQQNIKAAARRYERLSEADRQDLLAHSLADYADSESGPDPIVARQL